MCPAIQMEHSLCISFVVIPPPSPPAPFAFIPNPSSFPSFFSTGTLSPSGCNEDSKQPIRHKYRNYQRKKPYQCESELGRRRSDARSFTAGGNELAILVKRRRIGYRAATADLGEKVVMSDSDEDGCEVSFSHWSVHTKSRTRPSRTHPRLDG